MPPGRLCSVAGRQVMSTFGRCRVSATSSLASAPQPTIRTRGCADSPCWRGMTLRGPADAGPRIAGTSLVDQAARGLGGNTGVATVGVRPDRHPELLVERRPADEDDEVVAQAAILERLDDDLHVGHGRRE